MKKDKNKPTEAAELRRRAEERLRESKTEGARPRTEDETQRFFHELEVHQIELEMQNEELQQAWAEVEALLAQYTDLYDFAPVGYLTLGRDGTIRQVNLTGVRLLGVGRSRLVNRRLGLFVSDDFRPAFNAFLQKVFESQAKETCEVAILKEGNHPPSSRLSGGQDYGEASPPTLRGYGEAGPLFAQIEAVASEDGQECRAAVVDITDRKRAEEKLSEAKQLLVNIALGITDGILIISKDFKIIWANEGSLKMTEHRMEELVGNYCYKVIHHSESPCQPPHDICPVQELMNTGNPVTVTHVHFDEKGNQLFVEVSVYPIKDEKGEIIQFVHLCRDVTERKQAEKALQESECRYRTLFDSASDAIFVHGLDGRFLDVNLVACERLGYTREELLQMTLVDIDTPEFAVLVPERIKQLVEHGYLLFEAVHMRRDGAIIPVELSVRIIEYAGRQAVLSIGRDITERKHAEEEMATLQEQFRQSQKMEAIGRLAGGIAHDFNNFLTIIKGYSQLSLLGLKEDSPLRGNIEEINRATDRSADLIRQLLVFSRRQILEMNVLDLNTVLRNLDKMLPRVIGEDIELVTLMAEDLGRVKTDPGWIEQVIMNLAVNARDAMPSGGKLTIETANVELDEAYARRHVAVTPGRYVMLSLSDTGVGMTPEVRERVFEPFFTTKEKDKGTGLGLSTVYGIVKQSDGNIWVYSEPGQGTVFKIYLPRVEEALGKVEERKVGEGLPCGSETVLVVEDEEEVRKVAVRILSGQGYKMLEASQGVDAFLICAEHKGSIHLLVTDVVMPKMSGCELAERISSIRPEIKVLYMSGYTDNTIVHHGVLEEGVNYIQKPFTVEALAAKVRGVLDNKEG